MDRYMDDASVLDLSASALTALAVLAALRDADRAAVLRLHGITAGPRLRLSMDGIAEPTLAKLVPERDRATVYSSAAWGATYRPRRFVLAYVLFSPALGHLAQDLGSSVSLAKVGTTTPEDFTRRRTDLGTEEYGAYHRGPRRYEYADGFDRYVSPGRLQLAPQHPLSPVALSTQGIVIGLPDSLTSNRFEAEFNRRLTPLRLHNFADSDTGRALCARAGLDPAALRRFSKVGHRYKAATELTLFRPQADCGALARLAADIVVDAVLGLLRSRGPW